MPSQFRILGPIEADAAGGGSGRVRRRRTLSFLALLLVYRGRIVTVDEAVDELWDGAGPQQGRKAVHVVASRLQAALGEGVCSPRVAGMP